MHSTFAIQYEFIREVNSTDNLKYRRKIKFTLGDRPNCLHKTYFINMK